MLEPLTFGTASIWQRGMWMARMPLRPSPQRRTVLWVRKDLKEHGPGLAAFKHVGAMNCAEFDTAVLKVK
jgi:hypothetical protein